MTPRPFTAEGPYSPLEPRRVDTPRVAPDPSPFPRIEPLPEGLIVFAVAFVAWLPVAAYLAARWARRHPIGAR